MYLFGEEMYHISKGFHKYVPGFVDRMLAGLVCVYVYVYVCVCVYVYVYVCVCVYVCVRVCVHMRACVRLHVSV